MQNDTVWFNLTILIICMYGKKCGWCTLGKRFIHTVFSIKLSLDGCGFKVILAGDIAFCGRSSCWLWTLYQWPRKSGLSFERGEKTLTVVLCEKPLSLLHRWITRQHPQPVRRLICKITTERGGNLILKEWWILSQLRHSS